VLPLHLEDVVEEHDGCFFREDLKLSYLEDNISKATFKSFRHFFRISLSLFLFLRPLLFPLFLFPSFSSSSARRRIGRKTLVFF